jgi:hypothetical protein
MRTAGANRRAALLVARAGIRAQSSAWRRRFCGNTHLVVLHSAHVTNRQ